MIAQFLTSSSPQESENSGTQAFVTPLWPGRVRTSSLDGLIPAVFLFVFWFSLLSLKAALRPGLCMWVHSPGMVLHSFIGAGLQRGQRERVVGCGAGVGGQLKGSQPWITRHFSEEIWVCHWDKHRQPPPTLFGQKSADGKKAENHCFMKHYRPNAGFLSCKISSNYPKRVLWLPFIEFKLLQSLNIVLLWILKCLFTF